MNEACFANLPRPDADAHYEMRQGALELAATATISVLNIANAFGRVIGGAIADNAFRASAIPFSAAVVSAARAPLHPVAGAQCSSGPYLDAL